MPIYVFRDPATGAGFEEIRSVPERDRPAYRNGRHCPRITAPERIYIPSGRPSPIDGRAGALLGYKRLEEKQKLRRHNGYNQQTIKSFWS